MIIKFRVLFLQSMFSVQGLIYDNNASHDLPRFPPWGDSASACNLNSSSPTLLSFHLAGARSCTQECEREPSAKWNEMRDEIIIGPSPPPERRASFHSVQLCRGRFRFYRRHRDRTPRRTRERNAKSTSIYLYTYVTNRPKCCESGNPRTAD